MTGKPTAALTGPGRDGAAVMARPASQWLVCQVAHECYLIEVPAIKEIIKVPELTAIPRGPAWLKGICSLRGVVVAVIDVGRRLGLGDSQPTSKSRVVVLSTAKGLGGLLVDGVKELIELEPRHIDLPPALLEAPHRELVRGIVHKHRHTYMLLDLDKMVVFPPAAGQERPC
jgi:purine-binding chemotaxis protein CheW